MASGRSEVFLGVINNFPPGTVEEYLGQDLLVRINKVYPPLFVHRVTGHLCTESPGTLKNTSKIKGCLVHRVTGHITKIDF